MISNVAFKKYCLVLLSLRPQELYKSAHAKFGIQCKVQKLTQSKRVLLVDTNRGSYPLLKTLEQNGYHVTTVGSDENAPLAKLTKHYINADYTDPTTLQAIVDSGCYSAVIPGCTDASYHACASLTSRINKGIDTQETIARILNKKGLRGTIKELGMPQPEELSEADAFNHQCILIKPVDSFSGSGISRLVRPSEFSLQSAIERAREVSPSRQFVIEEFIEGQLYSHSAFLEKQKITQDFFVQEDCSDYEYAVDTSRLAQNLSLDTKQIVRNSIDRLANRLQLNDGLVHTQFILKDGLAYIIEMTRRHPGDLYGLLIQHATGIDYSAHYLNAFLPEYCEFDSSLDASPYIIRHTVTAGYGLDLWSLAFKHEVFIRQWIPLASAGTYISKAPQGRVAIVFFEQKNLKEQNELYDLLTKRLLYKFDC